jgi:hypothetical protein
LCVAALLAAAWVHIRATRHCAAPRHKAIAMPLRPEPMKRLSNRGLSSGCGGQLARTV